MYEQILKLNKSIYVLRKITAFPFKFFEQVIEQHFWELVIDSLFETSVMILWRIAVDSDKNGLTLKQFKNQISLHFLDHAYSKKLKKIIKERHLNDEIEKIKIIRHNFIAHMNRKQHIHSNAANLLEDPLELSDLEKYQKTVNEYFDLLNFGESFATLPWEYLSENKEDDIDYILDSIVKNSAVFNGPEDNPQLWAGIKDTLTESQLEILNIYRAKFNLPLV